MSHHPCLSQMNSMFATIGNYGNIQRNEYFQKMETWLKESTGSRKLCCKHIILSLDSIFLFDRESFHLLRWTEREAWPTRKGGLDTKEAWALKENFDAFGSLDFGVSCYVDIDNPKSSFRG